MKCEICSRPVDMTFLGKILGTRIRDAKGKRRVVCRDCQKMGIEEMRKKL